MFLWDASLAEPVYISAMSTMDRRKAPAKTHGVSARGMDRICSYLHLLISEPAGSRPLVVTKESGSVASEDVADARSPEAEK